MEAGKFSFKFSRQTQKNLVGSSKYAYFKTNPFLLVLQNGLEGQRKAGRHRRPDPRTNSQFQEGSIVWP
jgi:hypothetical protein